MINEPNGVEVRLPNGTMPRYDGAYFDAVLPTVEVVTKGSRFVLKGGKLNFVADNPYGNTEVKGRKFKDENNENIDTYDALLYKWNGRNNQLTKHLATPRANSYIRNVKSYLNNFDYYEERKYRK